MISAGELAKLLEAEDERSPLEIHLDRFQLLCVIGAVQLACRHPLYTGPTRKVVEGFVQQVSVAFPPAAQDLIAKGWDPSWDQPVQA